MNVGSQDSSWILAWAWVMLVRLKAATLSSNRRLDSTYPPALLLVHDRLQTGDPP